MERNTPVRKSHTSTADLLVWTENPPSSGPPAGDSSCGPGSRPATRANKETGGVGAVVFGGQMTEEEAESVLKRKPCSGYKLREITGSGIFANEENGEPEPGSDISIPNGRTGLRLNQQSSSTKSQISFSAEESLSPKKPVSLAEVAKQRELSGNLEKESETKMKKQISNAKSKELSGHDIFGPLPEVPSRPLVARNLELKEKDIGNPLPRNIHTAVKVSHPAGGPSNILFSEENSPKTTKKIHNQKFAELSGNNIFKADAPPESAERSLSSAKLREMSGNDIFADGKAPTRDYLGGVKKPPGGESSIALRLGSLQASPMHGWHGPQGSTSSFIVKKTIRVDIPVDKYPNYNFVGRLLGPQGNSLKRVEANTECRVLIRGCGSIKDQAREEMMRGKPGYEHLNDPLHIPIEAELPVDIIDDRLMHAREIIEDLLKPVDFFKKQQLRELTMINGTLREEGSQTPGSLSPFNNSLGMKRAKTRG